MVRGGFLRFLLLGGDDTSPVHEKGVLLEGAVVEGSLDLEGSDLSTPFSLWNCRFEEEIVLADAKTRSMSISQSVFPGLMGDRLSCSGSFHLREVQLNGQLRLVGAHITGNLDLRGGQFEHVGEPVIVLDSIEIGGSLFMRWGFSAKGEVRLVQARIARELSLERSRFVNPGGDALSCDYMKLGGGLFFRQVDVVEGAMSLLGAKVSALNDDEQSWRAPIQLNGFRYDRIGSSGATDAHTRIKWLNLQERGSDGAPFWPQPWEQLSRILRDMGHIEDARLVAMEKQRQLRRHKIIGSRRAHSEWARPWSDLDKARVWLINQSARLLHLSYGALAGYGYRPLRTLGFVLVGWALGVAVYNWGEARALFGPTAPLLQTSAAFSSCGPSPNPPAQAWTRCGALPPEHTVFSSYMYSLDVILPLIDLKQESDWGPIVHGPNGGIRWDGWLVRAIMWAQILFGWIASLLLASAAGRLVQKD